MLDFDEDELRVLKLSHYNQTGCGEVSLRAAVGVNGGYGESVINDGYHEAVGVLYQSVVASADMCGDAVLAKIRERLSETFLKDTDPNIAKIFSQFKTITDDSELMSVVAEITKEQYAYLLRLIVHTAQVEFGFVNSADPMVYPIIFCARHSIELCLKWLLRQVCYIKTIKENKNLFIKYKTATNENKRNEYSTQLENKLGCLKVETMTKTHDIKQLCDSICEYYGIDTNIEKYFNIILPYLSDYFIDQEGDFFRYWNGKDGTPNLESSDISLINLDIFKAKYDIVYDKLIELFYFVSSVKISLERTDTFTKNFSRWQIEELAKKLPQKNTWVNEEWPTIKQQIADEYGLSLSEFSEALDIIKTHREFCVYIGLEIQFKSFSNSSIDNYVQYVNGAFDDNEISNLLSFDDYIFLLTFLDMSGRVRDINGFPYFSEELDSIYADYKSRLLRPQSWDYIQLKNNFDRIIQTIKQCGQQTLFEKLQKAIALSQ